MKIDLETIVTMNFVCRSRMKKWRIFVILVIFIAFCAAAWIVLNDNHNLADEMLPLPIHHLSHTSTKSRLANLREDKPSVHPTIKHNPPEATQNPQLLRLLHRRHKHIKARVRKVCAENSRTLVSDIRRLPSQWLRHVFLDTEHKLLYCFIPKVACTNWKRVWLVLTGQVNTTDPMNISSDDVHYRYGGRYLPLGQIPPSQRQEVLDSYLKFVVVRDPLERLISAYRNKFRPDGDPQFRRRRQQLAQQLRKQSGSREVFQQNKRGDALIPFSKFLDFVQTQAAAGGGLNEHWDSQAKLCQPCAIDYDIIASFEHADAEADLILKSGKVDHLVKFPRREETYRSNKSVTYMNHLFSTVPDETIIRMYKLFQTDYIMFGFPYHTFHRPLINEYKITMENPFRKDYVLTDMLIKGG